VSPVRRQPQTALDRTGDLHLRETHDLADVRLHEVVVKAQLKDQSLSRLEDPEQRPHRHGVLHLDESIFDDGDDTRDAIGGTAVPVRSRLVERVRPTGASGVSGLHDLFGRRAGEFRDLGDRRRTSERPCQDA
jgi:hypothetical protein